MNSAVSKINAVDDGVQRCGIHISVGRVMVDIENLGGVSRATQVGFCFRVISSGAVCDKDRDDHADQNSDDEDDHHDLQKSESRLTLVQQTHPPIVYSRLLKIAK